MNKTLTLLLTICTLAFSQIVGGGTGKISPGGTHKIYPPAVGGAASGIYRPDADANNNGWDNSDDTGTNLYTYIDDDTTQPADPDVTTPGNVKGAFDARIYDFTIAEVTGTISTVRFWVMGYEAADNGDIFEVSITDDGTTWETGQSIIVPDGFANAAWLSTDFTSLGWTNTTDFRGRLNRTADGGFEEIRLWVVYVEINP